MDGITPTKRRRGGFRVLVAIVLIGALVIILGVPSIRQQVIDRVRGLFRAEETEKTRMVSQKVEEKVEKIVEEKMPKDEVRQEVGESLDHVVRGTEKFRVEGRELSVDELLKRGGVAAGAEDVLYGVRRVRSGDHVWGIHYEVLREFFRGEGIVLPPDADEPDFKGQSSGIGKVLKYDEKKAYVFNLKTDHLRSGDINVIYPGEEIVFFRMKDLFSHLKGKDLSFLDRLHFDGEHLYIIGPDGEKVIVNRE